VFKAVEALTKGIEVPMPAGEGFSDKDGFARDRVRVRWWDASAETLRDAAFLDDAKRSALPPTPIPERALVKYADPKPVFFGHYWLMDEPVPLTPRAACLDYSIGKGGRLCAYRFDGEPELSKERFVSVT
jgi:hypothetical protein